MNRSEVFCRAAVVAAADEYGLVSEVCTVAQIARDGRTPALN
jgi:hypothetical protein